MKPDDGIDGPIPFTPLLTDEEWERFMRAPHPYDRAADSSAYPDDANPENLCYVCGGLPDDERHGDEGRRWADHFVAGAPHPRAGG